MLTEDDDPPSLALGTDADNSDAVKSEVKDCVTGLLDRFSDFRSSALTKQMEAPCSCEGELQQELHSFVCDIAWVCQVLGKLETMRCLAGYWVEASSDVVAAVDAAACTPGSECLKTRLKVVEISAKVREAVAFSNVVLHAEKRHHAVNAWIDFASSPGQQSIWSMKPIVATTTMTVMVMETLKQQQRSAWMARSCRGWNRRSPRS
jgi:hypothetical protein